MTTIPAATFPPGPGADTVSFAPLGGMRVDATGHVTYDFDGHIHARGLDLDAGPAPDPPADNRVRWLIPAGTNIADLTAYLLGTSRELDVLVHGDGAENTLLRVGSNDPAGFSGIQAGSSGFVTAQAPSKARLLINPAGESEYLQLHTLQALQAELVTVTFVGVPAGGPNQRNVAVPWVSNHYGAAILSVGAANYGFSLVPNATAVNVASFVFSANPVPQDITVRFLTLGN